MDAISHSKLYPIRAFKSNSNNFNTYRIKLYEFKLNDFLRSHMKILAAASNTTEEKKFYFIQIYLLCLKLEES